MHDFDGRFMVFEGDDPVSEEQLDPRGFVTLVEERLDGRMRLERTWINSTFGAAPDEPEREFGASVVGFRGIVRGDVQRVGGAVLAGAQHVITSNVSDFPPEATQPHGIEAVHPDHFLLAMLDLDAQLVLWALARQADDLKDQPMTRDEVLDALAATVPMFVARVREVVDGAPTATPQFSSLGCVAQVCVCSHGGEHASGLLLPAGILRTKD